MPADKKIAKKISLPSDEFSVGPIDSQKALAERILAGVSLLPQYPAILALGEKIPEEFSGRFARQLVLQNRQETEDGRVVTDWGQAALDATWHIRRLSGIGGSEIGPLVAHFRNGESGSFQSARDIVSLKLCLRLPDRETIHMERGSRAEPWLQRMLHETNGYETDQKALAAVKGFRSAARPWMIGTPDDMVRPIGTNRRPILVDYKAPSAEVFAEMVSEGVSLDYRAQLHHYAMISRDAGVTPSHAILAPFDAATFQVAELPVEWDIDLIRDIHAAGAAIWDDHVMKGVLPDPPPEAIKLETEGLERFGARLAALDALSKAIENEQNGVKERINAVVSAMAGDGAPVVGKADFGPWSVTRKLTYNKKALVEMAEAFGIDRAYMEDPKAKQKFDAEEGEALLATIAELGRAILSWRENPNPEADGSAARDLAEVAVMLGRNGLPRKLALDEEKTAMLIVGCGGDPSPLASVSTTFLSSRKSAHNEPLRELRQEAEAISDQATEIAIEEMRRIFPTLNIDGPRPRDLEEENAEAPAA